MSLDLQPFEAVQITVNVEEIKNKFTYDQKERQRMCVEQYNLRLEAYKAMTEPQESERENSYVYWSSSGESQLNQNGNGLNSHSTEDYSRPEAETEYASKRQKLETDTTTPATELHATVNDLLNVPAPVPAAVTVVDNVKEEVRSVAMQISNDTNLVAEDVTAEVEI